jgi:hypothetical protein
MDRILQLMRASGTHGVGATRIGNRMKLGKILVATALVLGMGACSVEEQNDDDGSFEQGQTPGAQPWSNNDISCEVDTDCDDGETCQGGVCQMERCAEPFTSLAPLGKNHYFGTDSEVTVISDSTWIDAFEPSDGTYMKSWDMAANGDTVVDVAGGDLYGVRPHATAVAVEFSDKVMIKHGADIKELNIGIWPKAIAAGDVDGDEIDELVAFSEDGSIVVCDVDTSQCSAASIQGVQGRDVAVGDVDGDGFEEPIFLLDIGDDTDVIVWNKDADITGDEDTLAWKFSFPARAISAGDMDGDGIDEVATLEDGGWWGWTDDKVHVFSPKSEEFTTSASINGHTRDIALGDRDSDDNEELVVLADDQKFTLYDMADNAQIEKVGTWDITVGSSATRISMLDWDGNSASGELIGGPELVAGETIPTAVLMFPPYPANVAKGALNASITLGATDTTSEEHSDTVSLSLGMMVSFGAETPFFKAKVKASLDRSTSVTQSFRKSLTVGARYWVLADPETYGNDYGVVVLSCGCFHRYKYRTEDPDGLIGGSDQQAEIYIPVGGQTTSMSTKRYNAIAAATGTLPVINVPVRVGDVSSYPKTAQKLDGSPIPEEDMLFPDTPTYLTSDVGFVNFWLVSGETETNATAETITVGVGGSIGAGGLAVDVNASVGVTQGYAVTVGSDTIFAGGVPPIPDNPDTPEDEYQVHRFAFTPVVYREYYENAAGEQAGYYVMHYAVGDYNGGTNGF